MRQKIVSAGPSARCVLYSSRCYCKNFFIPRHKPQAVMAVNGSKVTHSNPSKQLSRHIKEKKSTVMNFSEWHRPSLLLKNGS